MCICFSNRAFLELIVYVVLFCGRTQCNRRLCKPEDVLYSPLCRDSFVVRIVCDAIEADRFFFLFFFTVVGPFFEFGELVLGPRPPNFGVVTVDAPAKGGM